MKTPIHNKIYEAQGANFIYKVNEVFQEFDIKNSARLREKRVFEFSSLTPEQKLDHLVDEISIRVKISQQQIFIIGELLILAKKVCSENGLSFQNWIAENFDFSYDTANNFMNVYRNCLGSIDAAEKIPISILYKISSPSFPLELREYILQNMNPEKFTNKLLINLMAKYKEGGVVAIEEDIEKISDIQLTLKQLHNTIDQGTNIINTLQLYKYNIEARGNHMNMLTAFDEQIKRFTPIGEEINKEIYQAVNESIDRMKKAQEFASERIEKMVSQYNLRNE